MIVTRQHDRLYDCKPAFTLALRTCAEMMETDLVEYGPRWDVPVISAQIDDKCVGFLQYIIEEEEHGIQIELMGIQPDYRGGAQVFILLLSHLKRLAVEKSIKKILFNYSPRNTSMADAARILQARVTYIRARIDLCDL